MLRGLIKGDNAFVPTAALRVAVRSGVDVAALLVTEQGRVRGDSDIVFDGAPAHASGAVRLAGPEDGRTWLDVSLADAEEAVTRVLLVVSTEEGALREAEGLSVEVLGPDGATVVAYEVTDAGDETAMVLAELYRRSGGWKFRAVGQGYVDGLTGLARDHGVVAEETPDETAEEPEDTLQDPQGLQESQNPQAPQAPSVMPEPLPEASKVASVPAQGGPAPGPFPVPLPAPLSVPSPSPVPTHWPYRDGFFPPRTLEGTGSDVLMAEGLPPGPVLVDLSVRTEGHTAVWTLTAANKEEDLLVNSTENDWRGRLLASVPLDGRLRLKLTAAGPWQARVLPLAAARRLSEDTLESWGPEVLLHSGEAIDVAFHYRGDSNLIVDSYDLTEHEDPAKLPSSRYPYINEIGRRREALPIPEGTVLVHVKRADGPWRVRLKQPSAAVSWLRRARR